MQTVRNLKNQLDMFSTSISFSLIDMYITPADQIEHIIVFPPQTGDYESTMEIIILAGKAVIRCLLNLNLNFTLW